MGSTVLRTPSRDGLSWWQRRRMLAHLARILALLVTACAPRSSLTPLPEQLYGGLFLDVQRSCVFKDQKTFVDMVPNQEPALILKQYRDQGALDRNALATFVRERFTWPCQPLGGRLPDTDDVRAHIAGLWPELTRRTTLTHAWSSLIPLPYRYVVPGGRFGELYYWDSYFTMLGLEASGKHDLVLAMLRNFAALIERFGHVPNGNRNYYLSRSQPPFFSHMVELAAEKDGPQIYGAYLRELKLEHDYWMRGSEEARHAARDAGGTGAAQRVVVLPGDVILNRYWDDRDAPRSEAYAIDEATARTALSRGRSAQEVYRDLRAAAESGWDFSSRWFDDDLTMSGIRTTAIVPIDLNSLLFHLEQTIAKACAQRHEPCAETYKGMADQRARAIARYLWNEHGYYADYDWRRGKPRENVTAATLFPLFVGVPSAAERERAERTGETVEASLLKAGGLATTTRTTDPRQQWDAPNGWAPLQWIAVVGLNRYGQTDRARQIATRFLTRVRAVFACNHELTEKYDVEVESDAEAVGSGGEYEPQNGFGWTNGVTLKLWELYPPASGAMECRRAPAEPLARKRYERPSVSCPAAQLPTR